MAQFTIVRLRGIDAEEYRELRLEGLLQNPDAFGASWNDEVNQSIEQFAQRIENGAIFGARLKTDATLIGTAGIRVPTGDKLKHKAALWGVYVQPRTRELGVGSSLLAHALDYASSLVEEVTLIVGCENRPALTMYRRAGFEQYGLEKRALKLGDAYVDEMLMSLHFANTTSE
jgi:ribosomal protein S18 acetylase RimI-like enzyme